MIQHDDEVKRTLAMADDLLDEYVYKVESILGHLKADFIKTFSVPVENVEIIIAYYESGVDTISVIARGFYFYPGNDKLYEERLAMKQAWIHKWSGTCKHLRLAVE